MSKHALVYASFDGIGTLSHGIGTQTQSFLHYCALGPEELREYDSLFVAFPQIKDNISGYKPDPAILSESKKLALAGQVTEIPLEYDNRVFWDVGTWEQLCWSLARELAWMSMKYTGIVVIAVDAVFTPLTKYLDAEFPAWESSVQVVHALYSTDRIKGMNTTPGRVEYEQYCVDRASNSSMVFMADIGPFFTQHLREEFQAKGDLMRFPQALELRRRDYLPMPVQEANEVLNKYEINPSGNLIVFAGRSDPIKGFDILREALMDVPGNFTLVALLTPYTSSDVNLRHELAHLERANYRYRAITGFSREILRALCSIGNCRMIVIPSRGEPLGTLHQEVSLWGRNNGPVSVVSNLDGLRDQVQHGFNGYTFSAGSPTALSDVVRQVLATNESEIRRIRNNAYQSILETRSFPASISLLFEDLRSVS